MTELSRIRKATGKKLLYFKGQVEITDQKPHMVQLCDFWLPAVWRQTDFWMGKNWILPWSSTIWLFRDPHGFSGYYLGTPYNEMSR